MQRFFKMEVETKPPRIPYRETIRGKTSVASKLTKQTGGRGQFGHVWLELSPNPGGGVEFGLLARDHQVLQNAAREGARFSALPANSISGAGGGAGAAAIEARIKSHVQTYLQNEGITAIPDANIVVDQNYMLQITLASGVAFNVRSSEVTITYPKSLILPGMNLLADPINLSGRAVFRNFY